MDPDDRAGIALYTPRHMRERRLLNVFEGTTASGPGPRLPSAGPRRHFSARRKRAVALILVTMVAVSIPTLYLTILVGR